ncbi:hypothetical protein E2562_016378 [Oryza meyeriana var. granulata]|uniref:NADP-dependent oxidoreductase domain-containing protein n=1 Tax=Oryza meyeriana var. granulata TaxID=110450 RepID=A0A6G1EX29_9ORYZ|nr:hypothetical protein E2562_016378 [Oryza meyeriana var. granulata]
MGSIPASALLPTMPLIGMGTAAFPVTSSEETTAALLRTIELGYRHFDTARLYATEGCVGEAVVEAVRRGLIASHDDVFITSKLWCSDAHADRVVPAVRETLRNLGMEYVDLFLVHWPVSVTPGKYKFPFPKEEMALSFDMEGVWRGMEECHRLGLAWAIGVSNFSPRKLEQLLSFTAVRPAVNQVDMNPMWQQRKLREICLRWMYELGDVLLVKSYNEKRMKENLDIFDWELTDEERKKISQLPQQRGLLGLQFISDDGPYKSVEDLWDGDM